MESNISKNRSTGSEKERKKISLNLESQYLGSSSRSADDLEGPAV